MKNTHSHSFFSFFAILVAVMVAGAYVYMYKAIGSSASRANTTRVEIQVERNNTNHEQKITDLYQSTSADWAKLPNFFISSDRVVVFIEAIEALGTKSGAEISLTSVDADSLDDKALGTLGTIRGHVSASGSWSAVMRTLALAESLPYLLSIDRVTLTRSGISGDTKNPVVGWNLAFDINTKEMVKNNETPRLK